MAQIPTTFINDLLSRVDIVDIIQQRVHLKKAGANYQALCPFHTEKTPSFVVNPHKQFYHCFGCGVSGTAVGFLMAFEKLTFVEAIEMLAAHVGIEVPRTATTAHNKQLQSQYAEFYALLAKAAAFYQQHLQKSNSAKNYLAKRGISLEMQHHFQIGYAPAPFEHLGLLHNNDAKIINKLLTTGMLTAKDQSQQEAASHRHSMPNARFRNRIMFPIRDRRGQVIGFGGRTISDDIPKYLNSPETPLFHKSNELYGLYEAKQSSRVLTQIIVVEGYMDVVALAQHGIKNVVATMGTAITPRQVQQLLYNASEIIFCFDGDDAGKGAAWRALENVLPFLREGISTKFLFLPPTEDPDSMVRKEGTAAFLQRLLQSLTLADFMLQKLTLGVDLGTLDGRAKLIHESRPLMQKMANGIYKQLLMDKIAELAKTSVNNVIDGNSYTAAKQHPVPEPTPSEISKRQTRYAATRAVNSNLSPHLHPIRMAIGLLINYPTLFATVSPDDIQAITQLNTQDANLLIDLIHLLQQSKDVKQLNAGSILEHWREKPEFELITSLALWEPIIEPETLKSEFSSIIQKVCEHGVNAAIQALVNKMRTNNITPEEKQTLQELIKTMKK